MESRGWRRWRAFDNVVGCHVDVSAGLKGGGLRISNGWPTTPSLGAQLQQNSRVLYETIPGTDRECHTDTACIEGALLVAIVNSIRHYQVANQTYT